jgi:hypothetical protein
MTKKRLARNPRRQSLIDDPTYSQPSEQAGHRPDMPVPGPEVRICCHGETVAPAQRQFQFRNLSDDPHLNLRLAGILTSARGTG